MAKQVLTPEQVRDALKLNDEGYGHSMRAVYSAMGTLLMGCDVSPARLEELLSTGVPEVAGENATAMKHGVAIVFEKETGDEVVYLETREDWVRPPEEPEKTPEVQP